MKKKEKNKEKPKTAMNFLKYLPMIFKVTSVYPFEVCMVYKGNYVEGWSNEQIIGEVEIPAQVIANGIIYNLKRIGDSALSYSTNVCSLKLNDGLEYIDGQSFRYIDKITELIVPNTVK